MACTLCNIVDKTKKIAKNHKLIDSNIALNSRVVYEKLRKLEAFAKAPAGEGSRFKACVSKMKKDGKSEESAKKICASIGRKKFGKKKFQKMAAGGKKSSYSKNSVYPTNSMINEPITLQQALNDYEKFFRELTQLKLTPVSNYNDIEEIKEKIWKFDDKKWEMENRVRKFLDNDIADDLMLNVRLNVRKEILGTNTPTTMNLKLKNKRNIVQNEDDILEKMMDKSTEEQIKVLRAFDPEIDEELAKDLLGV